MSVLANGMSMSLWRITTSPISAAALQRTKTPSVFDTTYYQIAYPGGDVPPTADGKPKGKAEDLIVRSYRFLGIDLQEMVHEDMKANFSVYPQLWSLRAPDPNIDHRRVLNLEAFFRRAGASLPMSMDPDAYRPGDLVTWRLPTGLPHIGIVTDLRTPDGKHPIVAHNIGNGPELEDMLFRFPITGHFRYGLP